MNEEKQEKQMEPFQRQNPVNKEEVCGQRDHKRPVKSNFLKNQAISVQGKNPIKESLNNESTSDKFSTNELSSYESSLPLLGQQMQNCSLGRENKLPNCKEIQTCPQSNKIKEDESNFTNSFLSLLSDIANQHVFPQSSIKLIQRILLQDVVKMDKQGLLNERRRKLFSIPIYSHANNQPQMPSQYQDQIKQQYPNIDQIENGLISFSQLSLNHRQKLKKIYIQMLKKKLGKVNSIRKTMLTSLSSKKHQLFMRFLNNSMKSIKIEIAFKFLCQTLKISTKSHISKNCIAIFLNKLIVMKKFFSEQFPQVIQQFSQTIQQFSRNKKSISQKTGINLLIPRYLNCAKIYIDSDNVIEAANQLYKKPNKIGLSKRQNWVHDYFLNYQKQTKRKAQEWELQQKRSHDKIKQMEPSMDWLQQHPAGQNTIEEKRKEQANKISFEAFKQKYNTWNPIQKPKYFQVQFVNLNSVKSDTFFHPEGQLEISE